MLSTLFQLFSRTPRERAARAAAARRRLHAHDAGPTTQLQLVEDETSWLRRRTPEQDHDRVLSSTARLWLKALPTDMRPFDLAAQHPRVVNRVALCWEDAGLIERLFDELLVDRRGGRKGFAPGVAEDLMRLRSYHENQFKHAPDPATWQSRTVAAGDRDSAFHRMAVSTR